MVRSVAGMEKCFKTGGRNEAVKYCNDWKNEIEMMSKELETEKRRGMDTRIYNQKRIVLNNLTKELNACIAAMNKLFTGGA